MANLINRVSLAQIHEDDDEEAELKQEDLATERSKIMI